MKIPSPSLKRKARIEIIPLIDIMFFLLATFVMVSLSMVKNQAVPVNLPVAKTSASVDRQDHVSLSITEDGSLFWNKETVSVAELNSRLAALKVEHPDAKVFINGDEKALFGQAISVLDEVRRVGISKVAIQTKAEGRK